MRAAEQGTKMDKSEECLDFRNDVLADLRKHRGSWCFQKADENGDLWTCGSFVPDDAGDEIERLRRSLRAIRNHWNEFGPENGFEETLANACKPIEINSEADREPWAGLAKAIEVVESHTCSDFCSCKYEILRELKSAQ